MGEKDSRRIDQAKLEVVRTTKLLILGLVAQNPGLTFDQLSERVSEILGHLEANGGKPIELGFGSGRDCRNLEEFVNGMVSGKKQGRFLERKGLDGASTFKLTFQGHRTLIFNAQSAGVEIPTPQA